MRAGALKTRITIEHQQTVQDAAGQAIKTWTPLAMVWADFRHLSGIQLAKNDAQTSVVRASARIRWRTGLDHTMRVLAPQGVYQIEAVLPDLSLREFVDLVLVRKT